MNHCATDSNKIFIEHDLQTVNHDRIIFIIYIKKVLFWTIKLV